MGKYTERLTRLDSTPLPSARANFKPISFFWHTFFFLCCVQCQKWLVWYFLQNYWLDFPCATAFALFYRRGAFLACCLTQKFVLETVKCRCAGAGMSWPRWNDENRVYKITTELPVRKPLSTCQNRSERYRYFCNVSESSSGIFWRLAEVFLQFLSFPEHLRLGGGKRILVFFLTARQRAGLQWEPLPWAVRLGWTAAALWNLPFPIIIEGMELGTG